MNKVDKKNFLTLPTILIIFVFGCIAYFTKNYTSAVFYSVLLILFVLINILIKLDMLCEYAKIIIHSYFKKELDKSRESLDELHRMSEAISKELEAVKSKLAEDRLEAEKLLSEEPKQEIKSSKKTVNKASKKKPSKKKVSKSLDIDAIVEEVVSDELINQVVEEVIETPKKRRGRPKKSA